LRVINSEILFNTVMESSTQNDTKQHENTQSLSSLTPQQMRAIVMRAEGAKFREISDFIQVPENTIKNWFRVGTEVYVGYKNYANDIVYSVGVESEYRIRHMAREATDTLQELMSKDMPPAIRLRASQYVLDKTKEATNQDRELRKNMPERLMNLCKMAQDNLEYGASDEEVQIEFERLMRKFEDIDALV